MSLINIKFIISNYLGIKEIEINKYDKIKKLTEEFIYNLTGKIINVFDIVDEINYHKKAYNMDEKYRFELIKEKEKLIKLQELINVNTFLNEIEFKGIECLNKEYLITKDVDIGPMIRFRHKIKYGQEIELFNKIKTSEDLIFVKYGELYKGYKIDMKEQIQKTFIEKIHMNKKSKDINKKIIMYFRYIEGSFEFSHFIPVIYDIQKNTLTVDYNSRDGIPINDFMNKVENHIGFQLYGYDILRMKKDIYITDIVIKKEILSHIVTNTPILSDYIYIYETQSVSAAKSLFKFHIKIGKRYVKANLSLRGEKEKPKNIQINKHIYPIDKKRKIVTVNLTDIKHNSEIEDIKNIIKYLFHLYKQNYESIRNFYSIINIKLPEKHNIFQVIISKHKTKNYNPDLWLKEPPTSLDIISTNQYLNLKKQLQLTNKTSPSYSELEKEFKSIILFPAPVKNGIQSSDPFKAYSIQHYYKSKMKSSIEVIVNTSSNNSLFPYIIKTSNSSQNYDQLSDGTIFLYENKKKHNISIKSGSNLSKNRFCYSDDMTKKLLNCNTLLRMGVEHSNSSLLYCICEIFEPKYKKKPDIFIKQLRHKLSNYYLYTSQETFHLQNVQQLMQDTSQFFDSKLFYRPIELLYNINLFIIDTTYSYLKFELPHFKFFHSRQKYNNSVILNRIGNQYSIYCTSDSKSLDSFLFSSNIFDIFSKISYVNIYYNHITTNNYNIHNNDITTNHYNHDITTNHYNNNNHYNHDITTNHYNNNNNDNNDNNIDYNNAKGQYIDSFGKCCRLKFKEKEINIKPSYIRNLPILNNEIENKNNTYKLYNAIRTFIDLLLCFEKDIKSKIIIKNTEYELIEYPYYIPKMNSYNDVISYIETKIKGFIYNGKIVMKNEKMYLGILQFIQKPLPILEGLNIKYLTLSNFNISSNKEFIVYGKDKFIKFLQHNPSYTIQTKLHFNQTPYIYFNHNKHYIIQKHDSIEHCNSLIYNWTNYKINSSQSSHSSQSSQQYQLQNIKNAHIYGNTCIVIPNDNKFLISLPL